MSSIIELQPETIADPWKGSESANHELLGTGVLRGQLSGMAYALGGMDRPARSS